MGSHAGMGHSARNCGALARAVMRRMLVLARSRMDNFLLMVRAGARDRAILIAVDCF